MSRDVNLSKTLMKMFLFVEAEIFQGTAGVCLQGEIEMLVSNIELISQAMNKFHGMLVFFSFGYYLCVLTCIKRTIRIQCTILWGICLGFVQGNDGSNVHLSFLRIWLY